MKHFLTSILLAAAALPLSLTAQNPAPVGDKIRTPWAEEVNTTAYPRPQMVRGLNSNGWQCLNGAWDYSITPKDEANAPKTHDGKILVPFCVESSLSGVGKTFTADDALWYNTTFSVNPKWRGKHVILNFEAVDWQAEVWVNDQYVGKHTGGYTHFNFDITQYLKKGKKQSLTVKVIDATDNDFQPRGKQVASPHGIWYTAVSGIWQSVWLECVNDGYISDYNVVSDIDNAKLTVIPEATLAKEGDQIEITLNEGGEGFSTETDAAGALVAKATVTPGQSATLDVKDMKLWSPDSPYLYSLNFKLLRKGKVIDEVQGYTSMRKISVVEDERGIKKMALNNEPLFQFGPLDQGWWPDGLYTAPSDDALKFDIQKTKDFGFNMIRKHIKVEPSRWFTWCDRIGMVVWQDMPSFAGNGKNKWGMCYYNEGTDFPATEEAKANYYKEWGEIMSQVKKFQCIVMWVPFNEAWSQFDTWDAVAFTKAQDPTRLVNMSSGGNWVSGNKENKHATCGDILDNHHYPEPYMRCWDFNMVNVLGEYGGIGYPVEGHLWQNDKNWGYVKYQSSEDLLREYSLFANKLIKLVGYGCCAAVYTQTTDVEGEVNGLMTYDRKVIKADENKLKEINTRVINSMK